MTFLTFVWPALNLLSITGLLLLVSADWRFSILVLAFQYVGEFILVGVSWPLAIAVSKLVAGWMAGAVLGMAMASLSAESQELSVGFYTSRLMLLHESSRPRFGFHWADRFFRLSTGILVWLVVLSIGPKIGLWFGETHIELVWGGISLIGMGLLQIGYTSRPLPVIIGLLTVLAGFEILYATVESSTLVAGLLASVNLCLGLIGAYLLLAPQMEGNE